MGPVRLVAYCRYMFHFLHCFISWLVRETEYGPVDQSAGVLWIVLEVIFLRSSDFVKLCRQLVKGCHIQRPPAESVCQTYGD
jgi:hypothetical protein